MRVTVPCPTCKGSGDEPDPVDASDGTCHACQGEGTREAAEDPEALPNDYEAARALYVQACDAADAANQRVRRLGYHLADIIKEGT
jgi:hypothetical protein